MNKPLKLQLDSLAIGESLFVHSWADWRYLDQARFTLRPKRFRAATWYGEHCANGRKLWPDSNRPDATHWQFEHVE